MEKIVSEFFFSHLYCRLNGDVKFLQFFCLNRVGDKENSIQMVMKGQNSAYNLAANEEI